jgi:curved DNA-binding protein CbpA
MLRLTSKTLYHYTTLNISRTASVPEIRSAFKAQSVLCHPDKFPGNVTKEIAFKKLNSAYQTLIDTEARLKYDSSNPDPESIPIPERARFHSKNVNELLKNKHGINHLKSEFSTNQYKAIQFLKMLSEADFKSQVYTDPESSKFLIEIIVNHGITNPNFVPIYAEIIRNMGGDLKNLLKNDVSSKLLFHMVEIGQYDPKIVDLVFDSWKNEFVELLQNKNSGKIVNIVSKVLSPVDSGTIRELALTNFEQISSSKYGSKLVCEVLERSRTNSFHEKIRKKIFKSTNLLKTKDSIKNEFHAPIVKTLISSMSDLDKTSSTSGTQNSNFLSICKQISKNYSFTELCNHPNSYPIIIEILTLASSNNNFYNDYIEKLLDEIIDNMSLIVKDTVGSKVFQTMFVKFPSCQDEVLSKITLEVNTTASIYTKNGSEAVMLMQGTEVGCQLLYPFFKELLQVPIKDNCVNARNAAENMIKCLHDFGFYEEHNEFIELYCNSMGGRVRAQAQAMHRRKSNPHTTDYDINSIIDRNYVAPTREPGMGRSEGISGLGILENFESESIPKSDKARKKLISNLKSGALRKKQHDKTSTSGLDPWENFEVDDTLESSQKAESGKSDSESRNVEKEAERMQNLPASQMYFEDFDENVKESNKVQFLEDQNKKSGKSNLSKLGLRKLR